MATQSRDVHSPTEAATSVTATALKPPAPPGTTGSSWTRTIIYGGIGAVVVVAVLYLGIPWIIKAFNTVSTDDAYVNSHVTFVAARVAGQVVEVRVDDNNRVKAGDVIVVLDKEPYQIQYNIKKSLVDTAKTDLEVAKTQVRAQVAQARGSRFKLEHTIEDVNKQISTLKADVESLKSSKAKLERAQKDYIRAKQLTETKGAISPQDFDEKQQNFLVAQAQVQQSLAVVYEVRANLGLPTVVVPKKVPKKEEKEKGDDKKDKSDEKKDEAGNDDEILAQVPANLDQTHSSVRQALADMLQAAAQLNVYPSSYDLLPKEIIAEFYRRDPKGDVNTIYGELIRNAPVVKQAEAKLAQTERDLDQADLNLRYCEVKAEIDGVVTRRNVNPGNNVQAGQSLMAIRSLTEIWVDANFKETQLRELRIGQRVELEVDMYGSHQTFSGRITGFTMGTGQTLALLPPQNATGNFVKIVQRLPVRVDLTDYHPEKAPLFVGLSVVPYVYFKEAPGGDDPNKGRFLQEDLLTQPKKGAGK